MYKTYLYEYIYRYIMREWISKSKLWSSAVPEASLPHFWFISLPLDSILTGVSVPPLTSLCQGSHTQVCALGHELISDLASPIFFWSTIHIHWHFRVCFGNLALLDLCFHFHFPLGNNSKFLFSSRSQKVKMGKLIRINICKVLWRPQVIVALLTDQNKTHIFWGWCHYCSASIFLFGMVPLFFCLAPSWNISCRRT